MLLNVKHHVIYPTHHLAICGAPIERVYVLRSVSAARISAVKPANPQCLSICGETYSNVMLRACDRQNIRAKRRRKGGVSISLRYSRAVAGWTRTPADTRSDIITLACLLSRNLSWKSHIPKKTRKQVIVDLYRCCLANSVGAQHIPLLFSK